MAVKRNLEINIKGKSDREFFIIHGYTGSPTDFNGLGNYLNKRFGASVVIPLLPGHGLNVKALDSVNYSDFFELVEKQLREELKKGKKIVVGGISLGGYLALELAAKYPVVGVFNIATPYKLRFPLNIWGLYGLRFFKKYWRKKSYERLYNDDYGAFYYHEMHINSLKVIRDAHTRFNYYAEDIRAPCLTINSKEDVLSSIESAFIIESRIDSQIKKRVAFDGKLHNIFFSEDRFKVFRVIGDFFDKNKVFNDFPAKNRVWHKIKHNVRRVGYHVKRAGYHVGRAGRKVGHHVGRGIRRIAKS